MTRNEIAAAIAEAISESRELPRELDRFVDEVADTVRNLAPVGTGRFRASIQSRHERNRLTANSLRSGTQKVGVVYSNDDPEKVAAIEYGTSDTEEHAPFRRAAARFM